jgi:hypothetical protein
MAKHHWMRRVLGLGVLAGLTYAVWRAIESNSEARDTGWEPQPFPFPPQPRVEPRVEPGVEAEAEAVQEVAPAATTAEAWVDGNGDTCPASHPVKGKLKSGIFHVPGGSSYDRTTPDRCYVDARAAEADGLRPAKR